MVSSHGTEDAFHRPWQAVGSSELPRRVLGAAEGCGSLDQCSLIHAVHLEQPLAGFGLRGCWLGWSEQQDPGVSKETKIFKTHWLSLHAGVWHSLCPYTSLLKGWDFVDLPSRMSCCSVLLCACLPWLCLGKFSQHRPQFASPYFIFHISPSEDWQKLAAALVITSKVSSKGSSNSSTSSCAPWSCWDTFTGDWARLNVWGPPHSCFRLLL